MIIRCIETSAHLKTVIKKGRLYKLKRKDSMHYEGRHICWLRWNFEELSNVEAIIALGEKKKIYLLP